MDETFRMVVLSVEDDVRTERPRWITTSEKVQKVIYNSQIIIMELYE